MYAIEKKELKTVYSTSHKGYHTFTKFMLSSNNGGNCNNKDQNCIENGFINEENGEEINGVSEKLTKAGKPRAEGKRPPGRPSTKGRKKLIQPVPSFFT